MAKQPQPEPRDIAEMLSLTAAGKLRGSEISDDDLGRLVDHLLIEGMSRPEITKQLQITDTKLDKAYLHVRERRALRASANDVAILAGDILTAAQRGAERMRVHARGRGVSAAAKIETEKQAAMLLIEAVKTLQSLGSLPIAGKPKPGTHVRRDY